jgi:hypothetical protein
MSRYDLIIDFETMSKKAQKCAVIDCSIMVFNWDRFVSNNPYTIKDISLTKRFKLSVADQVKNYNFEIDKSTLSFWEQQDAEVRANIKPKNTDLTVSQFIKEFTDALIESPKIEYWWSRSNTFEPIILSRLFETQDKTLQMEEYLKFWKVRDTRTFIDAKFDFKQHNSFIPVDSTEKEWNKVFKKHDSSWDILADVLRMQAIVRAEQDLEMIKL